TQDQERVAMWITDFLRRKTFFLTLISVERLVNLPEIILICRLECEGVSVLGSSFLDCVGQFLSQRRRRGIGDAGIVEIAHFDRRLVFVSAAPLQIQRAGA